MWLRQPGVPPSRLCLYLDTSAVRGCPLYGRSRGAKRTQQAAGPGSERDKTRPGRTTPVVASRGCCPGVGRTLRVVAPFVARLRPLTPTRRHTPVHAVTPRYQ